MLNQVGAELGGESREDLIRSMNNGYLSEKYVKEIEERVNTSKTESSTAYEGTSYGIPNRTFNSSSWDDATVNTKLQA